MPITDYSDHDATSLAGLVARGEATPSELVDIALRAIDKVNPSLNAVVHRMDESARSTAAGPLPAGPFRGVPLVVKDLDGFTAGVPYTMSSRFLQGFIPDHDAEVIARLRRAGFVILAKTNCPELGILGTTEPELRGPTHNPWSLDHTPGGSSGGSAALVASRAVPVGHGGDGGGSIRIPASACGLFGLKTSRGLLPLGPDIGEGWGGYVVPGVLTRSVRDSAAIYDVLRGPASGDPYGGPVLPRSLSEELALPVGRLRIGVCREALFGRSTHADCAAGLTATAALLTELGHDVEDARPQFDRSSLVFAYLVQVAASVALEVEDAGHWIGKEPTAAGFEPATWFLKQLGDQLTAADLQRSRDHVQAAGRTLGAFFQRYDVLLTPTTAYPAIKLGETALKPAEKIGLGVLRTAPVKAVMMKLLRDLADQSLERTPNTQLFNMTGLPAMSVPLHTAQNGVPVGMQFAAAYGGDGLLIRLAAQLEAARPWIGRKPGVCA
ncbi:6-aminohexanoate-cyclic-dimer hydrolase [Deltaproteobacteria bacterium]|nr:6-aminohexanoate-cyclic-dimer hydrolase [Deltaproteobacteria bacterium]